MRFLLSTLLLGVALPTLAANYDYYVAGNPADVQPATRGGLLMSGGGGNVDAAFRWFVERAGGGNIVVLRASGDGAMNDYLFKRIGGVASVETIVFKNRAAATDARVLEIIARAEGIFLAGGDQSRYVNYWKDTPVATAINAHVRAGKPLGGTSAGLAVQGEFIFSANFDARTAGGELESASALRNPHDPRITLETGLFDFELTRGVLTDSHFMERRRLGRLITFVARTESAQRRPVLGLGIDEKTALCVEVDGTARLFTNTPSGRAWLVSLAGPTDVTAKQPLRAEAVDVVAIGPDSAANLLRRHVEKPAAASRVRVADGTLHSLN